MKQELIERLRARTVPGDVDYESLGYARKAIHDPLCQEAADAIAKLEAEIERLKPSQTDSEVLEQCARIVLQLIPAGTINRSRCVDEILRITPSTPPKPQGEPVGWQPIETAPKDGTMVFVWYPINLRRLHASFESRIKKAKFMPDLDQWRVESVSGDVVITHWRPLFDAPKGTDDDG